MTYSFFEYKNNYIKEKSKRIDGKDIQRWTILKFSMKSGMIHYEARIGGNNEPVTCLRNFVTIRELFNLFNDFQIYLTNPSKIKALYFWQLPAVAYGCDGCGHLVDDRKIYWSDNNTTGLCDVCMDKLKYLYEYGNLNDSDFAVIQKLYKTNDYLSKEELGRALALLHSLHD